MKGNTERARCQITETAILFPYPSSLVIKTKRVKNSANYNIVWRTSKANFNRGQYREQEVNRDFKIEVWRSYHKRQAAVCG